MSFNTYPPITAWAVVYPQGLRAYQGGRHALFLDQAAAAVRAAAEQKHFRLKVKL